MAHHSVTNVSNPKVCHVYAVKTQPLNLDTVIHLFNSVDINKLSTVAPVKPNAGEIFIYKVFKYQKKEIWKDDQYRWHSKGRKLIPRKSPLFKKYYFDIKVGNNATSAEFQRHAYYAICTETLPFVVVHYIGDHTKASEFNFFSNIRTDNQIFFQNLPPVITGLASRYSGNMPFLTATSGDQIFNITVEAMDTEEAVSSIVHAEAGSAHHEDAVEPASFTFQDPAQLAELFREGPKLVLSQDSIFNVYLFAHQVKNFIWKIDIFPELILIAGCKFILEEMNKVLERQSPLPQLISYDSKFAVGDFFISPLLVRHTAFEGGPAIPVLFLIHERKYNKKRDELFPYLQGLLPSLPRSKHPFLTYREKRMVSAATLHLPEMTVLYSWDEVFHDVKRWLHHNNVDEMEYSFYIDQLRDLFNAESHVEYLEKLDEVKHMWSDSFRKYYLKKIHPDVNVFIGSWLHLNHGVYNPYTGIVNNTSNDLNLIIRRLQKWKEVPLDSILISLWYLQVFIYEDLQRSYYDKGSYKILPGFADLQSEAQKNSFLPFSSFSAPLEEVVDKIMEDQCKRQRALNAGYSESSDIIVDHGTMKYNDD